MNNNELNNNVTGQMPTPASLDVVAPVEAPGTNVVPPTVSQPVEMPGMQQPAPKKNSKKMLLIFPPQWTPVSPHYALPTLLGQLQQAGFNAKYDPKTDCFIAQYRQREN